MQKSSTTSKHLYLALTVCAITLSACATYQPKPIVPAELADTLSLPEPKLATAGYSYEQLLDLALQRSPLIRAELSSLRAAKYDARSARLMPAIGVTLGGEYSKDADAHRPWQFSASGDVPLDLGVRRDARVTSADLAVTASRNKVTDAIWVVRQALSNALTDRGDGQAAVIATDRLTIQAQKRYALAQARVSLGEDAGELSNLAHADLVRARALRRDAGNRLDQSNSSLAAILHIPVDIATNLKTELRTPALSPETMADRQSRALFARSDVRSAVIAYDQSETDLRLAIAKQYPEVRVGPGYTWERGVVKLPLDLMLILPTLDGNMSAIRAAEARREASGFVLENTVRLADQEISQARIDYLTALDRAAKAHADYEGETTRQMRRADANLKFGEADQLETLSAQMTESNVAIEVAAADQDVARALAKLENAWRQSVDNNENARLSAYLKSLESAS